MNEKENYKGQMKRSQFKLSIKKGGLGQWRKSQERVSATVYAANVRKDWLQLQLWFHLFVRTLMIRTMDNFIFTSLSGKAR